MTLTCTRCETEITNCAVCYQNRPFHFTCSPMFELPVEQQLDFNSLKMACSTSAGFASLPLRADSPRFTVAREVAIDAAT